MNKAKPELPAGEMPADLNLDLVAQGEHPTGAERLVYKERRWGITLVAERNSKTQPWVNTFMMNALIGQQFEEFSDLRRAYNNTLRARTLH